MAEAAMWTAIASIVASTLGFLGIVFGMVFKNRQQDNRLHQLEVEHKRCDEERTDLKTKLGNEWPSDPMELVNTMNLLKANGLHPTVAQLTQVMENVRRMKRKKNDGDRFVTE